MTLKNVKHTRNNPTQSTLRDLKEGECGGCGTFENVTDNCCEECAEGYPNPIDQETIDALDYYNHHLKLMAKVKDEDSSKDTGKSPTNYVLKGLSNIMGSGGLKRGELNIITCPNPRK